MAGTWVFGYGSLVSPESLGATAGSAVIDRRYWDLVDGAFAALGPDRRARYHATTPAPASRSSTCTGAPMA
jgi:hypothetical protein